MLDADRAALFQRWLAQHSNAVVRVAQSYTHRPEDARDLAQEIRLQVWRSLPTFDGRADAATWSYRVALNTALNWHRREGRRRVREQPLGPDLDPADRAPDYAQQQANQQEDLMRLAAAIRRLPNADAALMLLSLDGLSYRQMAEVVGITVASVGVKLHRARQTLRTLLDEDHHEP